jgi:excisionase family DNA binding protein
MYEEWQTKAEVRSQTGISERTLERKIQAGELRREFRNVPERKPIAILHPEDVKKLTDKTLTPIPMKKAANGAKANGVNNGGMVPHTGKPDLAALLAALSPSRPTVKDRLYLTIPEASDYSGLPQSFLRAKVHTKALPALKAGGWRIKRSDLERFDAASGKMSKLSR